MIFLILCIQKLEKQFDWKFDGIQTTIFKYAQQNKTKRMDLFTVWINCLILGWFMFKGQRILFNFIYRLLRMSKLSIYFSVMCPNTQLGEEVFVYGSLPELGVWNTGIKLHTDSNLYPQWKNLHPLKIEPETYFSFKTCIKNSKGQITKWENIPANREVAPTSSMHIMFEYSNFEMNFHVERGQNTLSYRKVTMDNVEQLGQECKSASSGWDEFVKKVKQEEKIVPTDLVTEAKFLYQNWKSQSSGLSILKKSQVQENKVKHIIFSHEDISQYSEIQSVSNQSNEVFQQVRYSQVQKIIKTLDNLDMLELYAFHFSFNKDSKQMILSLPAKNIGFVVISIDSLTALRHTTDEYFDSLAQKIHVLVIHDYEVLLKIMEVFQNLKYSIVMHHGNTFRLSLGQGKCFIYYSPQFTQEQIVAKNRKNYGQLLEYLEKIDFLLLTERYLSLPQKFRIQKLLSTKNRNETKINSCVVVHCEKLSDFSIETTTCFEKLALESNTSIYIVTNTAPSAQQIKKTMPLNSQKLVVVDLNGEIYCSKKQWNLFKQLSVQMESIKGYYKIIEQKIKSLIPDTDGIISYENNEMHIKLRKNSLTKVFLQWLNKQILKLSSKLNLPMQIKRMKRMNDSSDTFQYLEIKSILQSLNFYSRMIASAIEHSNFQFLISIYCLSFVKNSKFTKNMKKACEEKSMKFESFSVNINKPHNKKVADGQVKQVGNTYKDGISQKQLLDFFQKNSNYQRLNVKQ